MRRQGNQADIDWQVELVSGLLTRLIEQDDAMRNVCYLSCDLIETRLHGGSIASGPDAGRAGATAGIDGAEYAGRLDALILGRPTPGYFVLLTNPGFVLPPDLCRRADWERGLD